ncbi:hypothetical protein B0A50_06991 [Salinomyces thailandicus]|uniref:Uncharacterized protein n=1 Tax=Salinomyces thailandicus TaxID=706561 RepID=A0A4U0TPS2_9PEZI|nr:hypothetical protein B0A50_06991 [Salinomyces thailandica]
MQFVKIIVAMMAASVFAAPTAPGVEISSSTPETANGTIIEVSGKPFTYSKAAQAVDKVIQSMVHDADGDIHIGDDGVARSYTANGTVIDFRKLSNAQILAMTSSLPPMLQHKAEYFNTIFAGVSGHDVHDNIQIWDPPAWLRASNFDDDKAQKSANPQHDMKRQSYTMGGLYCRGQPCSTHTACQIMGCHSCVFVDNYVKKMCR